MSICGNDKATATSTRSYRHHRPYRIQNEKHPLEGREVVVACGDLDNHNHQRRRKRDDKDANLDYIDLTSEEKKTIFIEFLERQRQQEHMRIPAKDERINEKNVEQAYLGAMEEGVKLLRREKELLLAGRALHRCRHRRYHHPRMPYSKSAAIANHHNHHQKEQNAHQKSNHHLNKDYDRSYSLQEQWYLDLLKQKITDLCRERDTLLVDLKQKSQKQGSVGETVQSHSRAAITSGLLLSFEYVHPPQKRRKAGCFSR